MGSLFKRPDALWPSVYQRNSTPFFLRSSEHDMNAEDLNENRIFPKYDIKITNE